MSRKGEGKGKGYPSLSPRIDTSPTRKPVVKASEIFNVPGPPSPTGKKVHLPTGETIYKPRGQKDGQPGGLFGIISSWFEEADPKLTPKSKSGTARTGASSPEKKDSQSPPRARSRPLKPAPLDFCCTSRPKEVDGEAKPYFRQYVSRQDRSQSPSRISSQNRAADVHIGASPTSKSVMQANRASQNPSLSPPPVQGASTTRLDWFDYSTPLLEKGASPTSKSVMQANRASQNPSLSPLAVQGHQSSHTLKQATSSRKPSPSTSPRASKSPASQLWTEGSASPLKVWSPKASPPQKTLVPSTPISVYGVDHHRARLEGA